MQRLKKVKRKKTTGASRRPLVEAGSKPYSVETFNKKIQPLLQQAAEGIYQAQLRLEAIGKLLDPCLTFYETDVQRILNKSLPLQVKRGLVLYRMMSHLLILLEPTGPNTGVVCNVKLINFEKLSYDGLLDIKGISVSLIRRIGPKISHRKTVSILEYLSPEERDLYFRAKPYFGGRKKPTLKSLAIGLLGEMDEVYSEKNAINYLAAVKKFHSEHSDELGLSWLFVRSVESFGKNRQTGREVQAMLIKQIAGLVGTMSLNTKAFEDMVRFHSAAKGEMARAFAGMSLLPLAEAIVNFRDVVPQSAVLRELNKIRKMTLYSQSAVLRELSEFSKMTLNSQVLCELSKFRKTFTDDVVTANNYIEMMAAEFQASLPKVDFSALRQNFIEIHKATLPPK